MSAEALAAAGQRAVIEAFILISPLLATVLGVGVLISIIQAGTRLTDLTLGFVPRFLAVLLATALAGSWAGTRLIDFFQHSAVVASANF